MLQSLKSILVLLCLCSFQTKLLVLGKVTISSIDNNLKDPAGSGLRGGHFQRGLDVGELTTEAAIASLSIQETAMRRRLEGAFQTCGDTGTVCLSSEECVKLVDSAGKSVFRCELKQEEGAFSGTFPTATPMPAAPVARTASTFWDNANPASVLRTAPAPAPIQIPSRDSGCNGLPWPDGGCFDPPSPADFQAQADAAAEEQKRMELIKRILAPIAVALTLLCCAACRNGCKD